MKKKIASIIIILSVITILLIWLLHYISPSYFFKLRGIESTDFKIIHFDQYKVGENLTKYDFGSLRQEPVGDNRYFYEFITATIDKSDIISELSYRISEGFYESNFHKDEVKLKDKNQVIEALGDNYYISTYDWDQRLKSINYIDYNNRIIFKFIYQYDTSENHIIFIYTMKY